MPTIVSMGSTSIDSSGAGVMPAGIEPGDLAIWHIVYSTNVVVPDALHIPGWKLLHYDRVVGNSRYMGQALYYRVLDGSEHGPQPLSWNGYVDLAQISVYRFELSGTDRALAMAGGLAVGGGFHLLGHIDDIARAENRVDAVGDIGSGLGRSSDELGGLSRSADEFGSARRSGDALAGGRVGDAPASAGPSRARDSGYAPRSIDDRVHDIPPGSSGGVGAGERIPQSLRDEWFPGGHEPPLCSYCRTRPASTLDHVEPRSLGGDLTPGNIAPACTHCNPSKGPRVAPKSPPSEYVGPWPPPHWPQRMQDWWRQTYGGG